MQCGLCVEKQCRKGQNCLQYDVPAVSAKYDELDEKLMKAAAIVEGRYYLQLARIEESVKLAQELGCKTIGVAFCVGLADEAELVVRYFSQFFTVHSVGCKVCGVDKQTFGLEQVHPNQFEPMCNPAVQADVLNQAGTELNFLVGLCVGHDMIFNRHSEAPVSCLIAKDRVLAHNPAGALYSGYWRNNRLGIKK